MSFLKSTSDLKAEVLDICGELTDGTSPYDALAVRYLNNLYQGLLAGGNEFGIDIAEPWSWAQSKRPILLTLIPAVQATATFIYGSAIGTFAIAPAMSVAGTFLRADNNQSVYRVASHTAGSNTFTLDQPYIEVSSLLNVMMFTLDYQLTSDVISIDSTNNAVDFKESAGILTALIPTGSYTPTGLCAQLASAMNAVGTVTYAASFNSLTRMFSVVHGGANFSLLFASGPNAGTSLSSVLGYEIKDLTGANFYNGVYAHSGILRLTAPITTYADSSYYNTSAQDSGKIFMVDYNTFQRDQPVGRLSQQVPDRFCIVNQTPSGVWTARMNDSVLDTPIRAEVNYIPVRRSLVDNAASVPVVPGSYSMYLVWGAAHYIMMDKSDTRAADYADKAKSKLMAMVNDQRKNAQLAGDNFGRLIPRRGSSRGYGFYGGKF